MADETPLNFQEQLEAGIQGSTEGPFRNRFRVLPEKENDLETQFSVLQRMVSERMADVEQRVTDLERLVQRELFFAPGDLEPLDPEQINDMVYGAHNSDDCRDCEDGPEDSWPH